MLKNIYILNREITIMATKITANKSNTTTNNNSKPADHYLNLYICDVQIGYMVLDDQPELVKKAQGDDQFLNRLLKNENVTAIYRQRGVSEKPALNFDDI